MYSSILIISLALLSPSLGSARKFHGRSNGVQMAHFHKQIDDGIGKFSIELHKTVMTHSMGVGENVLVSPIGVYLSLAMAHLATIGQTRDELKQVMGLPMDEKLVYRSHQVIGDLFKQMQRCEHANVSDYNGLFVQTGTTVKSTYMDQIQKYYNAQLTSVDFTHGSATDIINKWFEMKTGGKISHFYDNPISDDVQLVFANALTFSGEWDRHFVTEQTKTETFIGDDGQEMQVPMMHKTDTLLWADMADYKFEMVGIPFKNGEHYMYILLPHEGVHLIDMVQSINYDVIQQILSQTTTQMVDLKMPILTMKDHEQMKDVLQTMGIHKLFDSPDLGNMLTHMSLKVTQIWHDTQMMMDETGVDAWAGTTQEYKIYSEHIPDDETQQFWVQKPFMFFIHHPSTKSILYYGSVHKIGGGY